MAKPKKIETETDAVMGYPKGYTEYQILYRRKIYPGKIGFHPNPKRPPIFANRLRMARRFDSLNLVGYSENTERGYEGLMKVFFAYTALEKLGDVLVEPPSRESIGRFKLRDRWSNYCQTKVTACIRENDPDGAFIKFVAAHCVEKLRNPIDDLIDAEQPNWAFLAQGIRNVFAHGHLTPAPRKCSPDKIATICDSLAGFLIEFLDEEFYKVIRHYCDEEGIDYDALA